MQTGCYRCKHPAASGPYTIVLGKQQYITLENVLIGEVWVLFRSIKYEMNYGWGLPDIGAELPTCENSSIRFFYIPKTTSATPQDNCGGKWVECDSNTLKSFSAVGYFWKETEQQHECSHRLNPIQTGAVLPQKSGQNPPQLIMMMLN